MWPVPSTDNFQTNLDSDLLWQVESEGLLWLEFHGEIAGNHLGVQFVTWKQCWLGGMCVFANMRVCKVHVYAIELF